MLIDIFKAHQKAIKHLLQKENMFASLLVDGYKVYVEGKLERLPDNVIVLDAAIKLCQCEIVQRKNIGKPGMEPVTESSFVNSLKMFPSLANRTSSTTVATSIPSVTKSDEATTSTTTATATFASTSAPTTSSIATMVQPFNNSSSRPRGRPPGSKNAPSKSLDWNQSKINPAAMAAMLGIYSNPSMPSSQYANPTQVSALLDEYYKLSAGLSQTSLLNALETVNAPSTAFPAPPKSFNSTATSKFPKYDMKSSIPSSTTVTPNPTSTVISVGSGQLTITPSSYTSSKPSKNAITRPNETTMMSVGDGVDFDIESLIPKSELLTNKIFSDMSAVNKTKSSMQPPISSNMTIPKDLPRSLTITPAPAGYSGKPIPSNIPHVTLQPESKKKTKSHKRSATVPYGRIPNFDPKTTPMYGNDVLAGYQQMLLNQMNIMSRNMVPNPMHKTSPFPQSSSKPKAQSSSKKEQKSVKTLPYSMGSMGAKSMLSDPQFPTIPNSSSRPYQPTTNFRSNQSTNKAQPAHLIDSSSHKFGTTPMTAHSPNKSPVLPPPIARQPSPAIHQARYYTDCFYNKLLQ